MIHLPRKPKCLSILAGRSTYVIGNPITARSPTSVVKFIFHKLVPVDQVEEPR
jgi:hypothetical protein